MTESCNCDDTHCVGNKGDHKHEGKECVHPDGTRHPIHDES